MAVRVDADTRDDVGGQRACHAEALSKWHGERDTAVHALRDVTLSIRAHAFTAVMGPSGSGKSTLLHCLAALDTPTSGRVFLGDTELTALSRRKQARVRRDRIGFVFQSFNLVPTLDALENITLPQLLAGRAPDREWLEHVIDRIGLGDRLHHRPSELSGGQQQRIALARALAGRPEVIFADEPTGNLDTSATGEMLTLLRDAVDQFDQTVVTVTHDPSITDYADQIVVLVDGQVVDRAAATDVGSARGPAQARGVPYPGGAGGTAEPDGPPRPDGQQTMRSRRRRHNDDAAPGRPMVGSDDEVEVARQERWLERIRAQFEAEHADGLDATPGARPDDPAGDPAATDTRTVPPPALAQPGPPVDATGDGTGAPGEPAPPAMAAPHDETVRYDRAELSHTDGRTDRQIDDGAPQAPEAYRSPGGHQPPPAGQPPAAHRPPAAHDSAVPDDGWLPAERSWLRPTGQGDDVADWDPRQTDPPPAPWSRPRDDAGAPIPHDDPGATQESTRDDPWAPADEHRAERYRWGDGQYRHSRRNGHRESGDPPTTGRWRPRPERADDADVDPDPRAQHASAPQRDHEAGRSPTDVPGGDELDGWTVGARPRRSERPFDDDDAAAAAGSGSGRDAVDWDAAGHRGAGGDIVDHDPAGTDDEARHAGHHEPEQTPGHTDPPRHEHERRATGDAERPDARAGGGWRLDDWTVGPAADDAARDPWTDVWDASLGDDLDEVWTPTFARPHDDPPAPPAEQPTADDVGPADSPSRPPAARDARPPAPTETRPTETRPTETRPTAHDDRVPERHEQAIPAPDPREQTPDAAPDPREQTPDAAPDLRERAPERAQDAGDRAAASAPEPDGADPADQPEAERVIDVTDAPLPPPLASLRSPRRPDQEDEALAALHSLQDQLQRLERGRGAAPGTGRREPRDVGRRR